MRGIGRPCKECGGSEIKRMTVLFAKERDAQNVRASDTWRALYY